MKRLNLNFLEACKKIIEIDSSFGQGNKEVAEFVRSLATSFGLVADVQEEIVNGLSQANVYIRPVGKSENRLMLQAHLDTVDPGTFAHWEKTGFNPFQPSIRGDFIHGLGAADAKLDFLSKLYAMKEADWSKLSAGAILIGTYGEEEEMKGIQRVVKENSFEAKYALVGEPTDLGIVYAGKGIAHMEIIIPHGNEGEDFFAESDSVNSTQSKIFQGKAAHSSNPEDGENAIVELFEYLKKLPTNIKVINIDGGISANTIPIQAELEFEMQKPAKNKVTRMAKLLKIYEKVKQLEKTFINYPNPAFSPQTPTINIGMARTYTDHFKIKGVMRWSSHISDREYIGWMRDLQTTCKDMGSIFRVTDVKRPFLTEKTGPFATLCKETYEKMYGDCKWKTQSVTNEANVLSANGYETLVFGPGIRHKNAHTSEEKVSMSCLGKAKDYYIQIIKEVCR